MKQKIIILAALSVLLVLIIFAVKDFFFSKPGSSNPYEFELDKVRTGDTSMAAWHETHQYKTSLSEIHGITADASGTIYISGKDAVEMLDAEGKQTGKFAIEGTALCIALNPEGNLLLGIQDHIEIWNRAGKLLARWNSCGDEAVITSIAASENNVFVADAGRKIVYRYDKKGNLLNTIGLKDPATGVPGFIVPSPYFDLGISNDGNLWVVNPGRHSFEKYTFEGKLLSSWSKASMAMEGFCGCCNPSNFAMFNDSMFVTSEKAIERVKIYNADGSFNSIVATPDLFEQGTKGLDLAVNKQNRILVLDPVKLVVRVFEPKKN
jgi:hypothetical protein